MSQVRPTAQSLRGLAHPLRVRLLGLLREHGPATATRLAELTGQSSGATSYHLRQLAAYGFVEEDQPQGTGRERWWRASHSMTVVEAELARQAPADAEAYLRAVALAYADRVERWLGEAPLLPPEWDHASTLSDWALRLTAAEAQELIERVEEVVETFRRDTAGIEHPADAERVVCQIQVMPFVRGTR